MSPKTLWPIHVKMTVKATLLSEKSTRQCSHGVRIGEGASRMRDLNVNPPKTAVANIGN
jgi:hypothetical protein